MYLSLILSRTSTAYFYRSVCSLTSIIGIHLRDKITIEAYDAFISVHSALPSTDEDEAKLTKTLSECGPLPCTNIHSRLYRGQNGKHLIYSFFSKNVLSTQFFKILLKYLSHYRLKYSKQLHALFINKL